MCKRILSANILIQEKTYIMEYSPKINILYGGSGEVVLLTLAGIFNGMPTKVFEAVLQWRDSGMLFISGEDGRVFVDGVDKVQEEPTQLMKAFHKYRFMNFKNNAYILDGSRLPAGTAGASDLLLEKLNTAIVQKDTCPLFICNFLERLDETVDLQTIFEALNTAGRQVFVAVPNYYKIEKLEGKGYGTTTHIL